MDLYRVNLLPPHLQQESTIDLHRLRIILVIGLPTVLILACYCVFMINYCTVKGKLAETKSQTALLAPVAAQVQDMIAERTALEATMKELDQIITNHRSWSGLLDDLGDIAPIDLWLTRLEIADKPFHTPADQKQKEPDPYAPPTLVSCQGLARTLPSIGVFLRNLGSLPYFTEVKLVRINAVSEGLEFKIIAATRIQG